jgi:pyruvate,water dikinase
MAVGVQRMVNARAAGVAFTLNPINGDRSKIAIDSSWGLGEAVVSGEVTPDNFLVDKVIFEVVRRVISPKHIEIAFDPDQGAVVRREVDPERRLRPSLTHDEIVAVARLAKSAEAHLRSPQDVEWAIDAGAPAGEPVVLLQSRPETVWSRKPRSEATTVHSRGMAGMVHTLIRGVKVETNK